LSSDAHNFVIHADYRINPLVLRLNVLNYL